MARRSKTNFESLSLPEQCRVLNLSLQDWDVPYDFNSRTWKITDRTYGKPEPAVAEILRGRGYTVAYCEGGPILLMMKSLCLTWFEKNHTMGIEDARLRYLEALCTIYQDRVQQIRSTICECSRVDYIRNFEVLYAQPFISGCYPGISCDLMARLYDCFRDTALAIFDVFVSDPYGYRSGWPDVTAISADGVRFLEVKTIDKLHGSQKRLIENLRDQCHLDISVVRLKPRSPHLA